jgi:8-oxo-dGTP diphosphatase
VRAVYDVVYHRYPQGPVLLLVYRCQWLNGTVQNLQVAEHAWVEPQRLSEFDFLPADLPLVRRLSAEGTTLP